MYYGGSAQDVYNRALEKSVAAFDQTQQLRLTWIYELPFGKGRSFLNQGGIVNQVLGGWSVTANQQYQSGDPLSIGTSIDTSTYLFNSTPNVSGVIRADVMPGQALRVPLNGTIDVATGTGVQYLNPNAFANPPVTANGVVLRLGTAPRYFGNLRGPYWASGELRHLQAIPIPGKRLCRIPRGRIQCVQPVRPGRPDNHSRRSAVWPDHGCPARPARDSVGPAHDLLAALPCGERNGFPIGARSAFLFFRDVS